jgi:hypothetical protein
MLFILDRLVQIAEPTHEYHKPALMLVLNCIWRNVSPLNAWGCKKLKSAFIHTPFCIQIIRSET